MSKIESWWDQFISQGGHWWVLGGAVAGLMLLSIFLLLLPWLAAPAANPGPTPIITVVPYPTETPTPTASPTQQPFDEATPTTTPPPSRGSFEFGDLVEISGTEGDGLRLRESAGLGAEIRLVALENEVFEVNDGPVESDGYIWWFLINPYDSSKRGWGVSNFLRAVEG